MPNWCENKLIIRADNDTLNNIVNQLQGIYKDEYEKNVGTIDLDVEKITPDFDRWAFDSEHTLSHRILIYYFDTKWTPIGIETLIALNEKFKGITSINQYYWECGCAFSGHVYIKDCKVIREDYNNNYRGRKGG
jgi:hypothetical protein